MQIPSRVWKVTRIFPILLAVLALLIAGCAAPAPTAAPGKSALTVKVGVDASLAPFASAPGGGAAPVGLDIDLIQAVMAQARLPYEIIDSGINIPTLLETCSIEVAVAALPITEALKARALVTGPYYTTGNALLVKQGNLVISGADQLTGMTVGSELGAPAEAEVAKMPGLIAKPFTNFSLAVMDLANGYIDAVAADAPHARSALADKRNNLKIAGAEFGTVEYGIAVCKERKDLFEQISAGLAAVKADGTLDKLIAKWLPRP